MNEESYTIEYEEGLNSGHESILMQGINAEAYKAKDSEKVKPFSFFVKDQTGKIHAGAIGITYYGCLYVDLLWVEKPLRKAGWGSKLIREAEKIGHERACTFATVNTMDWEALAFYQKLGYQIEFTREGYIHNSKKFMLRKPLRDI
jgi:ribosomal protein S18 acetylase RimI-like enzyme